MNRFALCLCVLFAGQSILAQEQAGPEDDNLFRFSIFDGLPSSIAGNVVQDSLGFVWMGSYGGLVRYNGSISEVMSDDPVLPLVAGRSNRILGGYDDLVIVEPIESEVTSIPLPDIQEDAGEPQGAVLLDLVEDAYDAIWLILRVSGDTSRRFLFRFSLIDSLFTPFTEASGHPQNPSCLAVDSNGILWVGTVSDGLHRYDPHSGTFTSFRHDVDDPYTLAHNGILTILPDSSVADILWIGTGDQVFDWHGSKGGLNRFEIESGSVHRIRNETSTVPGPSAGRHWAIHKDTSGRLWAGNVGAVDLVDPAALTVRKFPVGTDDTTREPPLVTHISDASGGRLWLCLGTTEDTRSVLLFDPERATPTLIEIPGSAGSPTLDLSYALGGPMEALLGPSTFFEDRYGTVWAPTRGGLLRYAAPSPAIRLILPSEDGLPGSRVRALHVDMLSQLWIGMQGAGLSMLNTDLQMFRHYLHNVGDPETISDNFIQTIISSKADPEMLWIGTGGQNQNDPVRRGSLNLFASGTGRTRRYALSSSAETPRIQALLEDREDRLWVGRTDGIFHFDEQLGAFTELLRPSGASAGSIKVLSLDEDGNVWMGSRGSEAFLYHSASQELRLMARFEKGEVNAILPAVDGKIWVGTDTGVYFLDSSESEEATFRPAAFNDGLQLVQHILQDDNGLLWTSGNTTIGGRGMVHRLEPNAGGLDTTRSTPEIPVDIGFRPPAGAKSSDGTLFFGGDGGVISINPQLLLATTNQPDMALTGFRIRGELLDWGEDDVLKSPIHLMQSIRLAHRDNDIQLDYEGIHTAESANILFAFRLDGYDNAWRNVGERRSAEYFKLTPGTYTFRLRGRTTSSPWSQERTLGIEILPPWWRTPVAYLAYVLLLIAVGFFVVGMLRNHVIRRERERARERELEQAREIEKAYAELQATQRQLVHAEKMASLGQLTAGIAHEVNNPINFVSSNLTPLRRDIEDLRAVLESYELEEGRLGDSDSFSATRRLKQEVDLPMVVEEIDHLLDGMDQGTVRTAEIVRLLQRFSRQRMDEKISTDLHEGIDAAILILGNQLENRIVVKKDYGDIPEVMCFPGEINQVFLNLLTNAIQAIEETGEIHITTWREEDDVKVSVQDSGPGIPKSVLDRIFEPFFTTQDVGSGTGLGLFISYRIVEEHGGAIDVKSFPGMGAEFVVTLPIGL